VLPEDTAEDDGLLDSSICSFGAENFAAIRPTARRFTGFSISGVNKLNKKNTSVNGRGKIYQLVFEVEVGLIPFLLDAFFSLLWPYTPL
jgi:hypothetical protein